MLSVSRTPLPEGSETYHAGSTLVSYWTTITVSSVIVSIAAAVAGTLLIIARRAVLTAGVMIALALVPALTIVGVSGVAGDLDLLARAAARWSVDVAAVVGASVIVLGLRSRVGRGRQS